MKFKISSDLIALNKTGVAAKVEFTGMVSKYTQLY
jgi:hypothetical protein